MENKLELKHLAPYLPYGLEIQCEDWKGILTGLRYNTSKDKYAVLKVKDCNSDYYDLRPTKGHIAKPILRPLSSLIKEIEHKGKKFVPIDRIEKEVGLLGTVDYTFEISLKNGDIFDFGAKHYDGDDDAFGLSLLEISNVYDLLNEWHFDWKFGLIEKGLAIEKQPIK